LDLLSIDEYPLLGIADKSLFGEALAATPPEHVVNRLVRKGVRLAGRWDAGSMFHGTDRS